MNFHGGDIYSIENKVLDFSSNINPLGVPESFKRELINSIDDFTKYPDINYVKLRKNIGEYLKIENTDYIIPGNGAVEIIYKAIKAVNCEKIYILSPTFSEYARVAIEKEVSYKEIDLFFNNYEKVNIDKLLKEVKRNSLVIICNPNNPTGTLISREEMCYLVEQLGKIDSTLIIDEAFMEFVSNSSENTMIPMIKKYNNLIIVRAATKFFGMPGIRLGYGITKNLEYIDKIKEGFEPWNINTSAVIAGSSIFKDKDYIKRSKRWINSEREYLFNELNTFKDLKVYKSSANFHLIKINRNDINAYKLKELLIEKGILIRVPKGFYNLSDFYFRLAVKDRKSNEILIHKLKEVFN